MTTNATTEYRAILSRLAAAVWDGESDLRCTTGVFTADEFRRELNLPPDAEVYLIGDPRTHAPFYVGTRYDNDGDTAAECARLRVVELAEAAYNSTHAEPAPFPDELLCEIKVGDAL